MTLDELGASLNLTVEIGNVDVVHDRFHSHSVAGCHLFKTGQRLLREALAKYIRPKRTKLGQKIKL